MLIKQSNQPNFEALQTVINKQRYRYKNGQKRKWGQLKEALKIAWRYGYIRYPNGVDSIKANTKEGRAILLQLAEQFKSAKLVTKSTLTKDYGWTESLIKKYGLAPDLYLDNPHYKRAAPMQLYSLNRVLRVSADEDVATDLARILAQRSMRSDGARKAMRTRRERALEKVEAQYLSFQQFIDDLNFVVPVISLDELLRATISHYNSYRYCQPLSLRSEIHLLSHVCRSYLYNDCTNYHQLLDLYSDERYREALHSKAKEACDLTYPNLKQQISDYVTGGCHSKPKLIG